MAQATIPNTVEDLLDVAENLDTLRKFVDPAESVALDFFSGKLLDSAMEIEAREVTA